MHEVPPLQKAKSEVISCFEIEDLTRVLMFIEFIGESDKMRGWHLETPL